MGRFKPIRQPRVSEEVIQQLKQAFIVGHFKTGDKLPPERELAKDFQVSRVPFAKPEGTEGTDLS
jgi:GntR family transcriptional repressor for pyruvate dehydrogenase complex